MVSITFGGGLEIALLLFLFMALAKYSDMEKRNHWALTLMALGAFLFVVTGLFSGLSIWNELRIDLLNTIVEWVAILLELAAFGVTVIAMLLFLASPFMKGKKSAPKGKPQPTQYKTELLPQGKPIQ